MMGAGLFIYTLDQIDNRGSIMLFVKDSLITYSLDRYIFPAGAEDFKLEWNLQKKKKGVSAAVTILISDL